MPFWVVQEPATPAVLAAKSVTVPEVTGPPPEVTVTVAVAAENCGTVAAGEKLIVVDVSAGGPAANTTAEAKSVRTAVVLRIDIVFFIVEEPFRFPL